MQFCPDFENWYNLILFVKFFETDHEFFIKFDARIMLVTPTKQNSFNFDEKALICFKKFNGKD